MVFHSRDKESRATSRRHFLRGLAGSALTITLPRPVAGSLRSVKSLVRLGLIADLHQDIMHDAPARLDAFLHAMSMQAPDAIIQLGDFATPAEKNFKLIDSFNSAHPRAFHVLGNHEIDGGFSWEQVLDAYGMERRYDVTDVNGLRLIFLDGNERPPNHSRGYPAHIGPAQIAWLRDELGRVASPTIVFSHQPLAGPSSIDNTEELRSVLEEAADRVILAVCGHTHIDELLLVGNIHYLHINSASYHWVGNKYQHRSYPESIHEAHPFISHTCPYRDPLFTMLTFEPESGEIHLDGRESAWVGPSPEELGMYQAARVANGEEIVPRIRARKISRS